MAERQTYTVIGLYPASETQRIAAGSPQEAVNLAERRSRAGLCCHCSKHLDLGDRYGEHVYDEAGALVLDTAGPPLSDRERFLFRRLLALLADTSRPPPELVPQMHGEAVAIWGIEIINCGRDEWDNHTTVENSAWLGQRLREVLTGAEPGGHALAAFVASEKARGEG